jgi:hypothetical protein
MAIVGLLRKSDIVAVIIFITITIISINIH